MLSNNPTRPLEFKAHNNQANTEFIGEKKRCVKNVPCGWLTNVVTQKFGILAINSDLFWKNGWRSLLYFCSTFKISSLACSFSL